MPRMSDTMEEGLIVEWHKKVGDSIKPGDLLAEVETDKATMELESYQEGTILYIGVEPGNAVAVEGVLAIIGEEGEDYKTLLAEVEAKASAKKAEPEETVKNTTADPPPITGEAVPSPVVSQVSPSPAVVAQPHTNNGRIKISPLAKRLAKENNINLTALVGSGEEGRIIKRDIEAYLANPAAVATQAVDAPAAAPIQMPQIVAQEQFEDIALSQMRKTIARRLGESKFGALILRWTM